jgi:flagellar biosynthetic protein FliR
MLLLIFLRIGGMIMTLPVFDGKSIPILFKAGLALAMSIVLLPVLNLGLTPVAVLSAVFGLGALGEILIGAIMGFSIKLLFAGVQLAGQLAGFQMGIGIANVFDPVTSAQVSVIGQFNNLLAMLIFLVINAHHAFLRGVAESFRIVPPLGTYVGAGPAGALIDAAGNLFIIAVQVGAPVIVALMLSNIALGIMARTVPQMNVFFVAAPANVVAGLLFIGFSIPFFWSYMSRAFRDVAVLIHTLLKTF